MSDLSGKVFIVTGGNSGIGFEAAKNFADRGAEVVLVCRSLAKATEARQKIIASTGNELVRIEIADFSSLKSVNELGNKLAARYDRIDVLCNNAGGANGSRITTDEGFEKTFVTNHLSSFLLTKHLLPALLKSAESGSARVVFTSSLGHKGSPLDFEDLNLVQGYRTLKAYGRSKLMNLLTAMEMHKRFGERNLICSSFHPGAVRTAIWGKGGILATILGVVMYPFMWTVEKGSETFIWLATSDDDEVKNAAGGYFFDCRRARTAEFATEEAAARLWDVSEQLIAPFYKPEN